MNLQDLFLVALAILLLIALGIGFGIMNSLATLTSVLDSLRQLVDSRLRPGVDKDDIDPVIRLAATLFEEKREAHKCPECGALPAFRTGRESFMEKERAPGQRIGLILRVAAIGTIHTTLEIAAYSNRGACDSAE